MRAEGFKESQNGALSSVVLKQFVDDGYIGGLEKESVRPASFDPTISDDIYQVNYLFQPKIGQTVREVLEKISKGKHDLSKPLLPGIPYIVRLKQTLDLPESIRGSSNPKSTSGRLDLHVRLLVDGYPGYDSIPIGYKGELWLAIVSNSFAIKLYEDLSLGQIRLFSKDTTLADWELDIAMNQDELLWSPRTGCPYSSDQIKIRSGDNTIILTLEAGQSEEFNGTVGWEALQTDEVIDLSKKDFYEPCQFFQPINARDGCLRLKRGSFYILSTAEYVRVPPRFACEMLSRDDGFGEYRSHYAGYIDPGWGWGLEGEGKGRPLTLEVRPYEPLSIPHHHPIAKIKFERVARPSTVPYDAAGSNYVIQPSGPRLAKQFKL